MDNRTNRLRPASLALTSMLCALIGTAHGDTEPSFRLLISESDDAGQQQVSVDASVTRQLADATGLVRLAEIRLDEHETVDLLVERFFVATAQTQFVIGHVGQPDTPLAFDPARIVLLRGSVDGRPGSHVFLALDAAGVMGRVELGPGATSYLIAPANARGLRPGAQRIVAASPATSGVHDGTEFVVCGVDTDDWQRPAKLVGGGGAAPETSQQIELAIDTDFEFFSLFGDIDTAAAYVTALYGAISDIYQRDVNTHLQLAFVRLWDTPEGMYDADDPLSDFRQHWLDEKGAIERDLTQLLTGRRNLPYGGVAYLFGVCNDFGYSVSGWINGTFADPTLPSPGNWDVVVTAHELGHNAAAPHTHSAGIDDCASGDVQRGTIMSYCHTVSGGVANIDLRFHGEIASTMRDYVFASDCVSADCNLNGIDDATEIGDGSSADANGNGVPDECEDCNDNGVLDDQDIMTGISLDLNVNAIPDECETDCNGNGVPDDLDISSGASADTYGDGVPDECEADCNDNGTSDYIEIQADPSLDTDRNAILDACQDCDGDGTPDLDALAGGLQLWIASQANGRLTACHPQSGVPVRMTAPAPAGTGRDVVHAPDGRLLMSQGGADTIAAFDPVSGAALGTFLSAADGLDEPMGLVVTADGTLLVANRGADEVLAFDAVTGTALGHLIGPGEGGLDAPFALAIGPTGDVYVTAGDDSVLRFLSHGAPQGALVDPGSGGLLDPAGLLFKPDGNLLVASRGTNSVLEYDGTSGVLIGRFDQGGLASGFWGLQTPFDLVVGPREDLVYVSSGQGNAAIHAYALETGLFQRSYYVLSTDVSEPAGVVVMPPSPLDCNLNMQLDACDIASGLSADGNDNGVPDECETGCVGDLNGDLTVGFADLLLVLGSWGPCGGCPADLDMSGDVGFADVLALLAAWGCDGGV